LAGFRVCKTNDFLAINFLVSIQWYYCLIEQCHCSLSIVKGQLNSSINKAPSHFAETENLQQEDSDAECIACGLKQKRKKASAQPAAAVQNVGAVAPMPIRQCGVPKHQRGCLLVGVGCSPKGAHGCSSKEAGG
jgi:hypothetical protein